MLVGSSTDDDGAVAVGPGGVEDGAATGGRTVGSGTSVDGAAWRSNRACATQPTPQASTPNSASAPISTSIRVTLVLSITLHTYSSFIICHFLICHFLICHSLICHSLICHSLICHSLICHSLICHFLICHFLICHLSLITPSPPQSPRCCPLPRRDWPPRSAYHTLAGGCVLARRNAASPHPAPSPTAHRSKGSAGRRAGVER